MPPLAAERSKMKFLINVIKTEKVEVKRQYETVTRFNRINTGETKEVEFKPEQNLLIVDGKEFKVHEVSVQTNHNRKRRRSNGSNHDIQKWGATFILFARCACILGYVR